MKMKKYCKTARKYLNVHTEFSGTVHLLFGVGIGVILTYPIAGVHPLRVGFMFLALGILGYVWAGTQKP
jgi:hypothetical protein